MPTVLAVDIGRTGCRAELWQGSSSAPEAVATGNGSLGLGAERGPEVAEAAILAVVGPLLEGRGTGCVDAVGVGAPGAMHAPAMASVLAERLAGSLPARMVAVTSDAITSHAGALAGKPGVVLAIGTGAVTVAIGADHRFHRVDGWGPWIGDRGSGAWIGRHGLQAVARATDGRGPATVLAAAAQSQFGSIHRLAAKLGSDPNPARTLAAFAPSVADAARNGDPVAMEVLEVAAAGLAHSMIAAARSLGAPGPVAAAIVGGLAAMGPILLDPLRSTIARASIHLELQPPEGSSVDGARCLAVFRDGIHEQWVVRAERKTSAATGSHICGGT
ncbi:MAG: N-acetylglucosamine kinase [Rhodanobacteraceae bacterium]